MVAVIDENVYGITKGRVGAHGFVHEDRPPHPHEAGHHVALHPIHHLYLSVFSR